jgi:hypothetical protein
MWTCIVISCCGVNNSIIIQFSFSCARSCPDHVLQQNKPDGKQRLVWIECRNEEELPYTKDPETSFWQRFCAGFTGLLPVDSQPWPQISGITTHLTYQEKYDAPIKSLSDLFTQRHRVGGPDR